MPIPATRPTAAPSPMESAPAVEIHGSDHEYLRSARASWSRPAARTIAAVDLFSGCGGFSLGVKEGAAACGTGVRILAAVDNNRRAVDVYRANFPGAAAHLADIGSLLGSDADGATAFEISVAARGPVDLVIGGPPCQGHSNLNNKTRNDDPKNRLYLHMARAATVFRPSVVLIENVQGSANDKSGAVGGTVAALRDLGYHVTSGVVDLSTIGVAQTRRRYIVLATLKPAPSIDDLLAPYRTPLRDLAWAMKDLEDSTGPELVDTTARFSPESVRRMDHLFDNGLFDLPDAERPACHRDKAQTYNSMYGRLDWAKPAQTITAGFYTMGMGRYVHPSRRRTLTGHEAARLQFFPDFFDFRAACNRSNLSTMIGNAVPMKLTYALVRSLIERGHLAGR